MALFVGYGPFKEFSCEVRLPEPQPLGRILEQLPIPENLRDTLVAVRGSRIIRTQDVITDGDKIHLFMALGGG